MDREGTRRDFSFLAGVAEELRSRGLVGEGRKGSLEEALRIYRDIQGAPYPFEQRTFIGGATTSRGFAPVRSFSSSAVRPRRSRSSMPRSGRCREKRRRSSAPRKLPSIGETQQMHWSVFFRC